ncbi:MAG: hypothetical protein HY549_13520 [Elusimicrobia bacterium]|nr:hypothetical protein [Elusimicrobiota bacterium]
MKRGIIGVFVDAPAGAGYISVDPESGQEGHFTLCEEVEYFPSLEGSLKRAKAQASRLLDGHLTVNAVAVFENRPAGEAYFVDSPTGNYKGSGHHPFSFVREYSYSPNNLESRKAAIQRAKEDVHILQKKG